MARYKFTTSGGQISFKDGDNTVSTLDPTSRSVEWQFDSTGGITFWVANIKYQTDNIANIEFEGVACNSQDDFETGIEAAFSGYASGGGAAYTSGTKIYVALLTQSGTDAPVATVLVNTLGGTVVWARGSAGVYTGTLSGVFTENKTACLITSGLIDITNSSGGIMQAQRTTANVVTVNSYGVDGGVLQPLDIGAGASYPSTIQILVFP